jgi:hypothetical protein
MLSSTLRDSRKLSSPVPVTFTQRRGLPPRSGVESLIQDVNSPFCSRRRRVTYTAAGATVLPVRRWIHDGHAIDAIAEMKNREEDQVLELAERFPSHAAPAFSGGWSNDDKNIQR